MLGICCDETYGAMKNHNNGYDVGYNDRNKDVNNDDNAASGVISDGPIFDPTTTPWSRLGLAEVYQSTTTMNLWPRRPMY